MLYTRSHEWVLLKGEEAIIGISAPFQAKLDEIVYVELPKIGHRVKQGDEVAVLESTKAAIDLTTPLSGTICEVNEGLKADPDLLKRAPEKEGWIFKLKVDALSELKDFLDSEGYQLMLKTC